MCTPNLKFVAVAIPEIWIRLYPDLTYFCAIILLLLTVYVNAKFGTYNFICSRDIRTVP